MGRIAGSSSVRRSRRGERRVSLTVLKEPPPRRSGRPLQPRRRPLGRWRALALIAVHILILLHVVHWLTAERTMAPVVLSNAMKTLELGQINPAFVLFCILILTTLLFGRFFCGWACHMAALQDLCLWILRKFGLRPAPFRARLLPWIPVFLALYMFAWPTFRREALAPLLERVWPAGLAWIGPVQPFPGWSALWTTTEMWSGLPNALVAIPFLLVCGFATVYFLGARGFCNYGCPYGGIFKPVSKLAPGRIIVDPDKCDACGMCTANCTSGVRVLDDLRVGGAVTDSRCVRTLDCVMVCPQNALKFRFKKPSSQGARNAAPQGQAGAAKPKRDVTLSEELILLVFFLLTLFILRGLYDIFPLLFAVGIAICALPIGWKLLRLTEDDNVRLHRFQLRRAGRLRPAGFAFIALSALGAGLLAQGGLVRFHTWRASMYDDRVTVSRDLVFDLSAGVPEEQRRAAAGALAHYRRASGWRSGGIGLTDTPSNDVRIAWLSMTLRDLPGAESAMERALSRAPETDAVVVGLAEIILLQGRHEVAIERLREAVEANPRLHESQEMLAALYFRSGRLDEGIGRLLTAQKLRPQDASIPHRLAIALSQRGRTDEALVHLERAAELEPDAAALRYAIGAQMLDAAGRASEARVWRLRSLQASGDRR